MPITLASIIWQAQQTPSRGNVPSAPQPVVEQNQLSRAESWNSVLHVARLVERNQRSTSLVLQLEVLNKPQTTYANAVYQVFARTRGSREWQEIHTNRGARLISGAGGKFVLESEVISIADLEREIRAELGDDFRIEDVELDCVVSVRYDLAGGGRDLREKFTYRQRYTEISTTSTTAIVRSSSTVTAGRTSSTETVSSRRTSNQQRVLASGRDDDDDDGYERDDDDDDDGGSRRRRRRRRHGSNSRTEQVNANRSSRRRAEIQRQVTRAWESVLHVARQTGSRRQSRNLVLQLEILNKPQTTYANVVYQVYAKTRGGRWQEIHTNSGARLIEAARGRYVLAAEVISLAELERELRAELGDDLRLEDVEINCVATVRYDLAGGRRDVRESFSYQRRYTQIVSTTTTEITRIAGSSAVLVDSRDRWREHDNCQCRDGHYDDDDDDDDDDGDDDDDE